MFCITYPIILRPKVKEELQKFPKVIIRQGDTSPQETFVCPRETSPPSGNKEKAIKNQFPT
jgi:hypothetical protein